MQSKRHRFEPIEAKYRIADDAYAALSGAWASDLRPAIGVADGERYQLRLFKKSHTALDDDLKGIISRGLRRVRRVLSSRRARSILVEVLEVVEDEDEVAIVMLDPGSPISGNSQRSRRRRDLFLTGSGRRVFWSNMKRVAEGLALCHSAGIVHGSVGEHSIFSDGDDDEEYRLGGFEACVHISDGDFGASGRLLRSTGSISFRQDWIDLAGTATRLLGADGETGPALHAAEVRFLERLANPPQFQLFDGAIVLQELRDLIAELDRVGSSADAELVLYTTRNALLSDIPSLTSGTIPAADIEGLSKFVEEDFLRPGLRILPSSGERLRLATDLAIYELRIVGPAVAALDAAHARRAEDRLFDAVEVRHRINLCRNRGAAEERVTKLGAAAKRWMDSAKPERVAERPSEVPTWYSLVMLEAFTLLREQFRVFPVEVLTPPAEGDPGIVWLAPFKDAALDERRAKVGLRASAEAIERELKYDDGKPNWVLSPSSALGAAERLPELNFEGKGQTQGRWAFAFSASRHVTAGDVLYLRPRKDTGTERAIKRRLQNIVSAKTNTELLRALNDPAQVAIDMGLRDIATPGQAPEDMEPTKFATWRSIASGQSISVVVGPPGVGKTYLISNLVKSILLGTPDARILISAQNHETLVTMEEELRKFLPGKSAIVIRVEKSRVSEEDSTLRKGTIDLLRDVTGIGVEAAIMLNQRRQISQALLPGDGSENAIADRVLRDTDNLMLRSSDVTLATTSSYVVEEMIADGEQFDWVFVEEAARANGAELIGPLLLGNRRVVIGDHNQLSPFDARDRQKFYDQERANELLCDAKKKLSTISDLPPEIDAAFDALGADPALLRDVLATAARLEEPFKSIVQREEQRAAEAGRPSSVASTLLEQSRMHPAIGELVSNVFYEGALVSSDRVKNRDLVVESLEHFPTSPIVVLNFPSLSKARRRSFERKVKRSYSNEAECTALIAAARRLRSLRSTDGKRPTLVVLSPYAAQVDLLERMLKQEINTRESTLYGFNSPRPDGRFVYTSDSFQGGEADVVLASLVRNNVQVGSRALGFMTHSQRMNVLLSRAKHKLVLVTSLGFIENAVKGIDPDGLDAELDFLRKMSTEIAGLSRKDFPGVGKGLAIVDVDEHGMMPS
ncbi:AAA domain-containing protein [Mesorhizobium sp. M0166]|uniref:DEAD/DEAH box helicase n=1 Tax=Mesorhizobium sp. M0166 TaxID=2956902 RepID=UPI00333D1AB8